MLHINPAQLIELMKWACKHVRHRCCGSVCLSFFNQEARTREKETQQTKDEISVMSKKVDSQTREHDFKQLITDWYFSVCKKINLAQPAIGKHWSFMKKIVKIKVIQETKSFF